MIFEPKIPIALMFFLTEKARYKIAYGGRGGGKSWSVAESLLIKAFEKKRLIVCARETQESIGESVHSLLKNTIFKHGLEKYFEITKTEIRCYNGSRFIFKGLKHNPTGIKSLEGADICWIEEAENISLESWTSLDPTIRAKDSEIWITFNPREIDNTIYQMFVVNNMPDSIVRKITYKDNPWFHETALVPQMEYAKKYNPTMYDYVWLGNPLIATEAQIFKDKFSVEEFDTPDTPHLMKALYQQRFFYGADWGFAKDPTCLIRCFIREQFLYIDYEAYGVGIELQDISAKIFDKVPDSKKWPIKADSARPETITLMKRFGYNIDGALKWAKSVEEGIEYLRSFKKIIIHPRCKHTIDEFRLYSYKVDKNTDQILPIVVDAHNHLIDSLRYSIDGYIKHKTSIFDVL